MLLTITTTHQPATDLGCLLVKNPARCQSFPVAFGQAHVFYPVATEDRCTAALLLDLDPVGLVRGSRGSSRGAGTLGQYVNDRPYVASSFLLATQGHPHIDKDHVWHMEALALDRWPNLHRSSSTTRTRIRCFIIWLGSPNFEALKHNPPLHATASSTRER